MPIELGTKGQPGFDDPIGLMMDCHRRIERFLGVLEHIADRFAGGGLSGEAVAAMRVALRYFRESAPHHTADEEASLFPRLREVNESAGGLDCLLLEAERLELQHRRAEALHASVDLLCTRWLTLGLLDGDEIAALEHDLRELRSLYAEHIAFEDETLFPSAARMLGREALDRIGREMAERRGHEDGPAPGKERGA